METAARLRAVLVCFAFLLAVGAFAPVPSPANIDFVASELGVIDPSDIVISPDGAFAYVAFFNVNAIGVYARDAGTGGLTLVAFAQNNVAGVEDLVLPIALALSDDGAHLYATAVGANAAVAFSRDAGTGDLTYIESHVDGQGGVTGLAVPTSIDLSPDGTNLYVTGFAADAVVSFSRDTVGGRLTFVDATVSGVNGVEDMVGPFSVEASPDGNNVYVVSLGSSSITAFARGTDAASLLFLESHVQDNGEVNGMAGARDLLVSPDGRHIYVISDELAHVLFRRNETDGRLSFGHARFNGTGGIVGMSPAFRIAFGALGAHVYAVSTISESVLDFGRDPITGTLSFLENETNGIGAVVDMKAPFALATSPDGKHLYVASFNSPPAIAIFSTTCGNGVIEAPEQCDDGGQVDGDGCSGACRREPCYACSGMPSSCAYTVRSDCHVPTAALKSQLQLRKRSDPSKNRLKLKWSKGDAVDVSEFDDPTTATDLAICIFHEPGSVLTPAFEARVLSGGECRGKACWKRQGTKGFAFKDRDGFADGLEKVSLRAGATGKSRILVKGRGANLLTMTLPMESAITVQIETNENGACWQLDLPASGIQKNDSEEFKGKGP
jgi:cysteine-rich repeat protein